MIQITWNDEDLDRLPTDEDWDVLELTSILYYLHETNPDNGLVRDKTDPKAPVSIAAVGMALATIPVVVERGVIIREFAARITRKRLRFLLDMPPGTRAGRHRLQGLLLPLPRHRDRPPRLAVRALDHRLGVPVRGRADGRHLFRPRHGRRGRDPPPGRCALPPGRLELGLRRRADADPRLAARRPGSSRTAGRATTRACCSTSSASARRRIPCRRRAIAAYCATYQWKTIYDRELLYSGPLFTHQLSHMWIDFRGIRDAFMREHGSDYFENSRQATFVQQEYAVRNPMEFAGYGEHCWGFTACDGPGWCKRVVDGVEREFFDYIARGAPFGPDDGTVAPWVVVASLPFAPEIVIPTMRHFARMDLGMTARYGFKPSFNQIVRGGRQPDRLVGHAVSLRDRSGAGGADDRELPHGPALGHHAPLRAGVDRPAPRRLYRRLAMTPARSGGLECALRPPGWRASGARSGPAQPRGAPRRFALWRRAAPARRSTIRDRLSGPSP